MANTPVAEINQQKYLKERVGALLSGKDLSVFGYDISKLHETMLNMGIDMDAPLTEEEREKLEARGIEVTNDDAVRNQVLLWLMAKRGDFPRNPARSGILWDMLGKISNDRSITEWENLFRSSFQDFFKSSGLVLNYLKLSFDPIEKTVLVSLLVSDAATKDVTQLIERFSQI